MKKTYISPSVKSINLAFEGIVAVSGEGGVKTGAKAGNEYNGEDVSYSNSRNSIWGDE